MFVNKMLVSPKCSPRKKTTLENVLEIFLPEKELVKYLSVAVDLLNFNLGNGLCIFENRCSI